MLRCLAVIMSGSLLKSERFFEEINFMHVLLSSEYASSVELA